MIQNSIYFTAKNGQEFELRSPRQEEAQASLDMMVEVAHHSPYILSTPEKFKEKTAEQQIKWFQEVAISPTAIQIAAYHKGQIVGLCDAQSFKDIKRKHRAVLGISVLPQVRGCGLGIKMMEVLIDNMKKFPGIKIIELDVMVNNQNAVKMYEKLGFTKAGIFPKAYILPSGEVSDNLTMYLEV